VRLFVALWPPDEVVAALRELPRDPQPDVRWTTEDQWHVTLRFLGSVDDVDGVVRALAAVRHPAVDVELGPATARLGPGVVMVPASGADSLAAALPFEADRPFTGHLTVARGRGRGGRVPSSLIGLPFRGSWRATSFALVRSQTRSTGAVYDDIATFPLE
jgi:2'-5' RNA ligase